MSLEQSLDNLAKAMNRLAEVGERFMAAADSRGPAVTPRSQPQREPTTSVEAEEAEFVDIGTEPTVEAVKTEVKKRGRPAGAKAKEAPVVEEAKEEPKTSAATEDKLTKEIVRVYMAKVQAASDAGTAFKLLSSIGFRGLGEVPEEKYSVIVKAAKAKLAELGVKE